MGRKNPDESATRRFSSPESRDKQGNLIPVGIPSNFCLTNMEQFLAILHNHDQWLRSRVNDGNLDIIGTLETGGYTRIEQELSNMIIRGYQETNLQG